MGIHLGEVHLIELHVEILYAPGGHVSRWKNSVNRNLSAYAKAEAPVNKRFNKGGSPYPRGFLRDTTHGFVVPTSSESFEVFAATEAPYAKYVLHGTGPIIKAKPMAVPDNPGFGTGRQRFVRGQDANNFLERAMSRTAMRHPSINASRASSFGARALPAPRGF